MKKEWRSDAARFNGEAHGELYSPDYAVPINSENKKKIEGQWELYSPPLLNKINDSPKKQQQPQLEEGEAKSKKEENGEIHEKRSRKSWSKSSSKL